MDTKILLENGTNELEILEFIVDGNYYGINVAKVKEIIGYLEPTPIPNAHPSIEGVFMPRDRMITAIDLMNCLQRGQMEKKTIGVELEAIPKDVDMMGDDKAEFLGLLCMDAEGNKKPVF